MDIVPWDPWKELARLRAQTDRLWDEFLAKMAHDRGSDTAVGFLPDMDVVETAYDFRVYMAVPGLVEDDIEIEATVDSLTVRGERQPPYDPVRQHTREWRYGFFERRLSLREQISVDDVRATYDAGVLTVVMPKQKPVDDEG